jgi:hypothetical protein
MNIDIGCKRLKISFRRDTTKDATNLKVKAEEEEYFVGTSLVRARLI